MFVAEVDSGTKLIHGFSATAVWAATVFANNRVSRQSGFMNSLPGSTCPMFTDLACTRLFRNEPSCSLVQTYPFNMDVKPRRGKTSLQVASLTERHCWACSAVSVLRRCRRRSLLTPARGSEEVTVVNALRTPVSETATKDFGKQKPSRRCPKKQVILPVPKRRIACSLLSSRIEAGG
jgi:hypothetical protein